MIDDAFSIEFDTYIKGPITGTVHFYILYDGGIEITIDGTVQSFIHEGGPTFTNTFNDSSYNGASFSYPMNQDQLYRLKVKWKNFYRNPRFCWMVWQWNYIGQVLTFIPSTNFYYPHYTGPSIINSY